MENEAPIEEVAKETECRIGEWEEPSEQRTPAVAVRFSIGRSGGVHLKPSPIPKNLREAKNAAIRYCKTRT